MPAQPLTQDQKEDADRLKSAWFAYRSNTPGASQRSLATALGFKSQGSVSQYINGEIPLNVAALLKFCQRFGIPPESVSPHLAAEFAKMNALAGSDATPISELQQVVTRLTTSGKMQLTEVEAMVAMLKAREGETKK